MTDPAPVFDDRLRIDRGYGNPGESTWAFLDRMAGDYWDDLRSLVNVWAGRVESAARKKIIGHLQSNTDGQFEAAFFELYVHESLVRAGFRVEVEPKLTATERCPDFFATRRDEKLWLECTTIGGNRAARARAKRFAPLQAALNSLKAPGVVLRIEVDQEGLQILPEASLRGEIAKWLDGLDRNRLPLFTDGDRTTRPFEWDRDGWLVRLHPCRLTSNSPAVTADRVLTVGPVYADFPDDSGKVRRALARKGSAYGTLDAPWVVAINAVAGWPNDDDVVDALYGGLQYPIHTDGTLGEPSRGRGGYWWSNGPKHEDVSGVLVSRGLNPWSACTEVPTLWLNPAAKHPTSAIASWRSCRIVGGQPTYEDSSTPPRAHFGLSDSWPRGEAFPRTPR